jgi:hypothetical protein
MKKICNICNKEKELSEFPKNKRTKDGYSGRCLICNRKVVKEHYYKNKKLYLEKNKRYNERKKEWWLELKSKLKCNRCSENNIVCLDFHHIDPTVKEGNLSHIWKSWSKQRVLDELKKCEVLCKNCHAKEHWG